MTRLVLVRHGETVWHAENRYVGQTDIPLTQRGLNQANALAIWARTANLSAVWSSSLLRARLTAQPAADAIQADLQTNSGLNEISFGRAEGLTDKEMHERFPDEREAFLRDPVKHYLPGGEDPVLAVRRGIHAIHNIASSSGPNARILIVAHSTLIRLMLCDILGTQLSLYRTRFPRLDNCTITELTFSDAGLGLLTFNAHITYVTGSHQIEKQS